MGKTAAMCREGEGDERGVSSRLKAESGNCLVCTNRGEKGLSPSLKHAVDAASATFETSYAQRRVVTMSRMVHWNECYAALEFMIQLGDINTMQSSMWLVLAC